MPDIITAGPGISRFFVIHNPDGGKSYRIDQFKIYKNETLIQDFDIDNIIASLKNVETEALETQNELVVNHSDLTQKDIFSSHDANTIRVNGWNNISMNLQEWIDRFFGIYSTNTTVGSVTVSPNFISIKTGESRSISAVARSVAGSIMPGSTFVWQTPDSSFVSISPNGTPSAQIIATGNKATAGPIGITASKGGKSGGCSIIVEGETSTVTGDDGTGGIIDIITLPDSININFHGTQIIFGSISGTNPSEYRSGLIVQSALGVDVALNLFFGIMIALVVGLINLAIDLVKGYVALVSATRIMMP